MQNDIGTTLKKSRISAKISVKKISDILTEKGFKASESTIYSWENGNSQPTPGALLTMCKAYKIDDVLKTFGYDGYKKDGSIQPTMNEIDLIEKYRTLDPFGQETVNLILNREAARSADLLQKDTRIADLEKEQLAPTRFWAYYGKIACAGAGFIFDDIPTAVIEAPPADADFIIGVSGDSMEPDYHDGEKLYVKKTEDIRYGEVGIFTIRNECFLKEYGETGLVSKNPRYADIPGDEDVRLIGKVVGKVEE